KPVCQSILLFIFHLFHPKVLPIKSYLNRSSIICDGIIVLFLYFPFCKYIKQNFLRSLIVENNPAFPEIPSSIYADSSCTTPWTNPLLRVFSVGTIVRMIFVSGLSVD